jgi:hypothetical protein
MRDLAAGNWPNCGRLDSGYCHGLAVECRELDLECLGVGVNVHHRTDVANFEALSRYGRRQNDSIVLFDHLEGSLLARIRGHEPRRIVAAIDDPDRRD